MMNQINISNKELTTLLKEFKCIYVVKDADGNIDTPDGYTSIGSWDDPGDVILPLEEYYRLNRSMTEKIVDDKSTDDYDCYTVISQLNGQNLYNSADIFDGDSDNFHWFKMEDKNMKKINNIKKDNMTIASHFVTKYNDSTVKVDYVSSSAVDDNFKYSCDNLDEYMTSLIDLNISHVYLYDWDLESTFIRDWCIKHCSTEYDDGYNYNSNFYFQGTLSWNEFTLGSKIGTEKDMINKRIYNNKSYCICLFVHLMNNKNLKITFSNARAKTHCSVNKLAKDWLGYDTFQKVDDQCIQNTGELSSVDVYLTDVYVDYVARAMCHIDELGNKKLTLASDALKDFKNRCNDSYKLIKDINLSSIDDKLRQAYRGGLLYLNKDIIGKTLGRGVAIDRNSIYPWVMKNFPLPFKYLGVNYTQINIILDAVKKRGFIDIHDWFEETDKKETDKKYCFVARVRAEGSLKKDGIPVVSPCLDSLKDKGMVQNKFSIEKLNSTDVYYFTNYDLQAVIENYNLVELVLEVTYVFEAKMGLFDEYIDYWYSEKKNAPKGSARREFAKLMLNSLYGKFGIKQNKVKSRTVIKNGQTYNVYEGKTGDALYFLPWSLFITSIARYYMSHDILELKKDERLLVAYSDTDSIHCIFNKDKFFDYDNKTVKELENAVFESYNHLSIKISEDIGGYKYEDEFNKAKYLAYKTYMLVNLENKNELKICGADLSIQNKILENVNIDKFEFGMKVELGKTYLDFRDGGAVRCRQGKYQVAVNNNI